MSFKPTCNNLPCRKKAVFLHKQGFNFCSLECLEKAVVESSLGFCDSQLGVYVMGFILDSKSFFIKIGWTADLEGRKRELQYRYHKQLKVYKWFCVGYKKIALILEKKLKSDFPGEHEIRVLTSDDLENIVRWRMEYDELVKLIK